jgi:capsular polysaccharide transport system permease protein
MARTPWQVQKSVIFALFIRELRTRFGSYKGGYIWLLAEPIAHIVVLMSVRSFIRDRSAMYGADFPVFIAVGVIPFILFRNIALRVMDGGDSNRGLFSFKQIKPIDAFVARTMLDAMVSFAVFLILLTGMYWIGLDVPFRNPLPVLAMYVLLIFGGLGLGMVFCVATHYMPEAKTLFRLSMMPLYLMSGIIFPISSLPQWLLPYLMWNPLLHAIEFMRGAFFVQYHVVAGISPLFVVMSALTVLAFGYAWYWSRRLELLAR